MSDALKPCPFCGAPDPRVYWLDDEYARVICDGCGAWSTSGHVWDAKQQWNMRAAADLAGLPEELVKTGLNPVLMRRWWDQYGYEAADEIERLTRERDRFIALSTDLMGRSAGLPEELVERLRAKVSSSDLMLMTALEHDILRWHERQQQGGER